MSTSNIFSNVFIYGNCTVQGTITTLGGSAVSQWTTAGSTIYYTAGNVGIGTATLAYKLSVDGGAIGVTGTNNYLYYAVTNSTASGAYMMFDAQTAGGSGRKYQIGTTGTGNNPGTGCFEIYDATGNATRFVLKASGFIGIGTTNPGSLLTVSGGGSFGSGYTAFTAPTNGLMVQGNVGIGLTNPAYTLDVNGSMNVATMNVATISCTTGLMFRNRIINGDFRLDQRNAGASFTPTVVGKTYTLDRWWGWCAVGSKFSVQRSTEVPVGRGFTNSVLVTSLSPYSTPVGGYYGFGQYIEGYNIADMGFGTASATTATLSFWARSSIAGTFSVSLENGSFNRSYIFNYTISSVNTWQYFTLPFTADTTGTWDSTTGQGLRIWWDLGSSDTTYAAAAGSWLAADVLRTTGAVSLVGTNAATLYIAGAQLEKGSAATPFEFRPFAIELALCQRYFQLYNTSGGSGVSNGILGIGHVNSTSTVQVAIPLKVSMRVGPTSFTNTAVGNYIMTQGGTGYPITSFAIPYVSSEVVWFQTANSGTFATVGGAAIFYAANSSGFLGFSAEL